MSQVMGMDGEQVHFLLNDSEEISTESLGDIIYSDGTRAILVNGTGQILQGDSQTVVLQDDEFNQYYINDESGDILVADEQEATITQSLEDSEVVQFIDDDGNIPNETQIIYVNEDGYAINDSDLSQYQITNSEDTDTLLTAKGIKLETQVVDLEELLRQQEENETDIIDDSNDVSGYQYAILKDGKLHIQSYNGDIFPMTATDLLRAQEEDQNGTHRQEFDLSRITGRNLLTGQTVSLHNYMDKLQRKIKEGDARDVSVDRKKKATGGTAGLRGLLNKKLTLGKTPSGKRLVGRVIHVEKKKRNGACSTTPTGSARAEEDVLSAENIKFVGDVDMHLGNVDENEDTLGFDESTLTSLVDVDQITPEPDEEPPPALVPASPCKKKVLIQEKLVSRECFSHIRRTLSGLMTMDSVRKKLQYKSIVVKVVERQYNEATGGYTRQVSYGGGRMREEFVVNDEGEVLENWSFAPDEDVVAAILGDDGRAEQDGSQRSNQYAETTNVTVVITYEKNNHRAIRVILNPAKAARCNVCDREFGTGLQLRVHTLSSHPEGSAARKVGACEVCGLRCTDAEGLRNHRDAHVEEGKLFKCLVADCGKFFLTARRLQRHGQVHGGEQRSLECSVCLRRCSSESALKRHLVTAHMPSKPFGCESGGKGPYKYYECDICKRTFSRHSNLQRHIEIHKGSEELYHCSICGCSYHYMSSLTRHVVQNHIKRQEGEAPSLLIQNDTDEA